MTNLEKWKKKKLAEAKDGRDFLYQLTRMNREIYDKQCYQVRNLRNCEIDCIDCVECKTQWLKQEAE